MSGCATTSKGTCGDGGGALTNAKECFDAVAQLVGPIAQNVTLDNGGADHVPPGCFVVASAVGTQAYFNANRSSKQLCGSKQGVPIRSIGTSHVTNDDNDHHRSASAVGLHLDLDDASGNAAIVLTGPAHVWFGFGLDATSMSDAPHVILVEGSHVTERKLVNHMPGTASLEPSIHVASDTVERDSNRFQPPVKKNHLGTPVGKDVDCEIWMSCGDLCQDNPKCQCWTFFPKQFATSCDLVHGTC